MSVSVCLCLCDTLTGCVVNPLDMCRRIFLKISKDVLCAHVIDTCHVDGLQTQLGYSLTPQKSKPRNYRYKNMTTAGLKKKKKNTLLGSYLSSSCPYPAERCADCCSPPHRNGNVALASLSARWPPDKYKCTIFQQTTPFFTHNSLPHFRSLRGCQWSSSNINLIGPETFLGSKWFLFTVALLRKSQNEKFCYG